MLALKAPTFVQSVYNKSMPGWFKRILICLILGLVTTIAVAWACAEWSWELSYTSSKTRIMLEDDVQLTVSVDSFFGLALTECITWTFSRGGFGAQKYEKSEFTVTGDSLPYWSRYSKVLQTQSIFNHDLPYCEVATGLPFLALAYEGHPSTPSVMDKFLKNAFVIGNIDDVNENGVPKSYWCILPLRPIWPGLIANVLIYGVLAYLFIFGRGDLKRPIRKRRGRCPICGYDLRGDFDTGCPECGTGREETTV